ATEVALRGTEQHQHAATARFRQGAGQLSEVLGRPVFRRPESGSGIETDDLAETGQPSPLPDLIGTRLVGRGRVQLHAVSRSWATDLLRKEVVGIDHRARFPLADRVA